MVASNIFESRTLKIQSKSYHFQPSCPFRNGEGVSTRSDPCSLRNNSHNQSINTYETPFPCSCSSSCSILKLCILIKGNLNFLSQIKTCLKNRLGKTSVFLYTQMLKLLNWCLLFQFTNTVQFSHSCIMRHLIAFLSPMPLKKMLLYSAKYL